MRLRAAAVVSATMLFFAGEAAAQTGGVRVLTPDNFFQSVFGVRLFDNSSRVAPPRGQQRLRHDIEVGHFDFDEVLDFPRASRKKVNRKPQPQMVDTADCYPGCPRDVMDDPTLRRGDMVMTDAGLMVFRGGRAPHVAGDFQPASEVRLSARDRRFVQAIERTPGQSGSIRTAARSAGTKLQIAEVASIRR